MTQNYTNLLDGNRIPKIGLGVWQATDKEAQAAINTALDVGYRSIDTATIYANEKGVGAAINGSGLARKDIFVTTKLWNTDQHKVKDALHKSLDLMNIDYVDCYLIHWPAASKNLYVSAWEGLIQAQQEGLIKSIGVSNFLPEHLQRIINETKVKPILNQIELHPLLSQKTLSKWCAEKGIKTQAWSPLGQGGTGIFDHNEIINIAKKYGKSPAQIVLRWHIQNDIIVIPKSVTPWRISENFNIFDFSLIDTELKIIDRLNQNKRLGPNPQDFV